MSTHSMNRAFPCIALILFASSCSPAGTADAARSTHRYLAIGDSYTVGEGVTAAEAFPAQLTTLLRTRGEDVADPVVVAKTGWTVDEMLAGIDAAEPEGPFDLVTLLIGVNDQYRGLPVDGYRADFAAALDRAISLAGGDPGNVVVISIPDWGVSPFAADRDSEEIAAEIDQFNEVARMTAEAKGARWVDITPFSRSAADRSMFAPDGLHPSAMAYAEWGRQILPSARAALD